MSERQNKGEAYFKSGYNCAQSVVLAFADVLELDDETLKMITAPFGGGIARTREICGTVSGMCMVAGLLRGYSDPKDIKSKTEHYAFIQGLLDEFKKQNGSVVCRELLGVDADGKAVPTLRNSEFYKKRPCAELVRDAIGILENKLPIVF